MPSPVVSKYKSPPDYYSDTIAIQGVFSKTIEPMSIAPKLNGSRLSNITTNGNMGRSADLNQLKTNQTNVMGRLADLKTNQTNGTGRLADFKTNQTNGMGRLADFKTNQTNGTGRLDLTQLKTNETKNSISTKLQEHRQAEPEPVHLRSFQSTSASTNASDYPIGKRGILNPIGSSCTGTRYGCCDDGVTTKNEDGTSCPVPIGSNCTGSQYGCCDDGVTAKNADGSSCPSSSSFSVPVGGCAGTQYGCCPDGVTAKYADGSNCPSSTPVGGCAGTQYGCCPDGVTAKNADGSNCPKPNVTSCTGSQYGCCTDGVTAKNADGSNCASYPPSGPSVYILPIQPPPQPNPYPPPYPPYPTQPNDPYSHSEQPLDTVYLSPPMGKPTVPTCPKPQPCPPCGRCPEPSFDCKKVPNYSSTSNVLPIPVLTDFSQFGM